VRLRPRATAFVATAVALTAWRTTDGTSRGGFVTLLGRDTVALESFTRTSARLDGDIVVRVPGTVHFHYVIERDAEGTLARTAMDVHAPGLRAAEPWRVRMERHGDSLRVVTYWGDVNGRATIAVPRGAQAIFMTGFDASYGLYNSLGMYELALDGRAWSRPDTLAIASLNPLTGRDGTRSFARPTRARADADFFRIAWTHLALDSAGRVLSADASETTEQTRSLRVEWVDVPRFARDFAARDRAGRGLGGASPNVGARASLDGASIVVAYGSPRLRGRHALGGVVPYDRVWRTGANEATVLHTDRPIVLGGTRLAAGSYSLWTVPRATGVDLVINARHGQWGTDYKADADVARVPMRVATVGTPREEMVIAIDGAERVLRIAWDTFEWRVPIAVP
jgi:hypothetical protein